jgi:hypothetical protein
MKHFIFLLILFFSSNCFASWYIVNQDNEIVAISDNKPDDIDLENRKEISVFSEEKISINKAEYRNGKIIEHVLTAKEKKEIENEKIEKQKSKEVKLSAIEKLKTLGLTELEVKSLVGE